MNKQEIKKAIETLKDMKGIFDTRSHKQYSLPALDLAISALEQLDISRAEVQGLSKKLAEWQKSDADKERYTIELYNRARKAEEKADYWEREAKKWCAKLGEIRLLIGEKN